jgi:tetratricopeptide (TPR) repeat protein
MLITVLTLTALAGWGADSVPLFDNLGSHHRRITTTAPRAQQYFDQGLRLVYAFNHGEAVRAFSEGTRLDPRCAMCWWGIAYALGPHVNAGMDSASGVRAWKAAQKALTLAPHASASEQALIRALARRYAPTPPRDRGALDSAYAHAALAVARRFPRDDDAAVLAAEALMDLRPWNYWQKDGSPYPGTTEIVNQLERVLARSPQHPGACHYYIHAVEAATPDRAVACAERLASLMPGAGHIVHMPAHIYIRVGRWADAIEINVHAVHADEQYIAGEQPTGFYPIAYYPHNHHFLAFAATMAGRSALAIEAGGAAADHTPIDAARAEVVLQPIVAYRHLVLQTFGRWDELIALPLPPADLRAATGLVAYARGMAFVAKGRLAEARAALDTVRAAEKDVPAGEVKIAVAIASHALGGEISAAESRLDEAIAHLREAVRLEDGMQYIEPPVWHQPVRHLLGALLLQAGRAGEAETLYREDLKRFPENGWSLQGLAQSLAAQGRTADAAEVRARFAKAWETSDVALARSRF